MCMLQTQVWPALKNLHVYVYEAQSLQSSGSIHAMFSTVLTHRNRTALITMQALPPCFAFHWKAALDVIEGEECHITTSKGT